MGRLPPRFPVRPGLQDQAGQHEDNVIQVLCGFGRGFEEGQAVLSREEHPVPVRDLPTAHLDLVALQVDLPAYHVKLVAHDNHRRVNHVVVNLGEPVRDPGEGRHAGDVVHEDHPVGVAVVVGSEGVKALLACGVPDLELHLPPVQIPLHHEDVGANGGLEILREDPVPVAPGEGGLSDPRLAHHDDLEGRIVISGHIRSRRPHGDVINHFSVRQRKRR